MDFVEFFFFLSAYDLHLPLKFIQNGLLQNSELINPVYALAVQNIFIEFEELKELSRDRWESSLFEQVPDYSAQLKLVGG